MNTLLDTQLALGSPTTILFTVLRASVIYTVLLLLLRLSGGRQFGQLTTIDLVTLLLLSNVVQNAMIGPDNSLTGGLVGAATLLILYRLTVRLPFVQARLEPHPVMLVYRGEVAQHRLRHEGISVSELEEAAREHGVPDLSDIETAVLEMNGTISIIPKSEANAKRSRGWTRGAQDKPRKIKDDDPHDALPATHRDAPGSWHSPHWVDAKLTLWHY